MEKNSIEIATLTSTEGKIYIGEFKDGQYNGMGTLTSPDGSKYVGEFKNGKFHGQGILTDGEEKHVGEFENDLYNGIGYNIFSLIYETSDEIVKCFGQYKNGKLNGIGIMTWSDGTKYEGEFKDGRYNGNGILIYSEGQKYKGEFKDGKKTGIGTSTSPNGKKYKGEFKDNRYNGNGILIFPNGKKYKGEFKDNRYNGKGILIFPDGNKYKGEFKNGILNGKGTHTNSEGKKYVGEFENGKIIRRNNSNIIKKEPKIIDNGYYLFFDTETTGLPRNWKAHVTDLDNWPRLVQLAYLLFDKNGNKIAADDFIIKPNGFTIPIDSSRIHGISNERAISEGITLLKVLQDFNRVVEKATYLVAHNISFDEKIVGAEFLRNDIKNSIACKNKICIMEKSTDFCAIEEPYGYKWPKLSELHYKLFGIDFEEAHNAAIDINATAKCFWELKKLNIL